MRLPAFVSPKSIPPKMKATRSNFATPTSPQLSPPTSTSVAARTSSFFMLVHLLSMFCRAYVLRTALVKLLFMSCIVTGVETVLRIGELSRRSGVSPELLRAWERRYGLLRPTRTAGGLRLYSLDDLERVRLMQQHLAGGYAAAEAAVLASQTAPRRDEEIAASTAKE